MAETPTKIHYPTNADTFDPAGDMEQIANTVHHIVPVANVTERNAIADAYNPTPERPLYVSRSDTGRIEVTRGGGWRVFSPGITDSGTANFSFKGSQFYNSSATFNFTFPEPPVILGITTSNLYNVGISGRTTTGFNFHLRTINQGDSSGSGAFYWFAHLAS